MADDLRDLDLTGLYKAPLEEFAPLLQRAAAASPDTSLKQVDAVLRQRILHRLRQSSRREILEEAHHLHRFLASPAGRHLQDHHPVEHYRWEAWADLLQHAAGRTDLPAVDSILKSYPTHGQSLLEVLAESGEPVPRARIKRRIVGIAESQLSHMLRDFEEAHLIVRYRQPGSKEVLVALGPAGREVVPRTVLPAWVQVVVDRLEQASNDADPVDIDELVRDLLKQGAPSTLAAERLARAIARVGPQQRHRGLQFIDDVQAKSPGFADIYDVHGAERPVAAFALPSVA